MAYIDLLVHNKGSVQLSHNTYITIIKCYIIHVHISDTFEKFLLIKRWSVEDVQF